MCSEASPGAIAGCIFHGGGLPALSWPSVPAARVRIGGLEVTCEQAEEACRILESSGTCAIRQVLAARRHPLAGCDYHSVYRQGMDEARQALAATHRPGGAGRHLAKHAFAAAVRAAITRAACDAYRRALAALAQDERYATAIAREAVVLQGRRGIARGAAVVRDCDFARAADAIAA